MLYLISIVGGLALIIVCKIGDRLDWWDKRKDNLFSRLTHFFGGFFAAMFVSAFFKDYAVGTAGLIRYSVAVIGATALIGILWEIYEYLYGLYKFKKSGAGRCASEIKDTIEDLFFDIFGAFIFVMIFAGLM